MPDTEERAHYFWDVDNRGKTPLKDIAERHGICPRTGRRWLKERSYFGDDRRIRKRKAKEKGHKLGRPSTVPIEELKSLLNDQTNPVRGAPLNIQAAVNGITLAPRSLQYNLSARKDAHLYVQAYTTEVSQANAKLRQSYGQSYKDKPISGFWDSVFFYR